MLAQPYFGFAKGPVLLAHQTENGQQLRLVELVLAELDWRRARRGLPGARW
jgi:hypothetical protein